MDIKRIGIIMALAWIITELVLFNSGISPDTAVNIGMGINVLFLLIAIFIAVRHNFKERRSIFLDDVKAGMKHAGLYAVITSAFIYCNFKWIDTAYLPSRVEARVQAEETRIETQGGWEVFSSNKSNGNLTEKSYEDYLDDVRDNGNKFIQPGFILGLSLVALVSIGFIYTLILTALNRKVLSRLE